jgi:serine/threonine-protein kinase
MSWARGAVAVAVALAVTTGAVLLLGYSGTLDPWDAVRGRGPIVEVPDLSGLARPRAVADVESAGLSADVDTAFSLTAPRGAVIDQDPDAGAKLREGSLVRVVVSRGVLRVEMPEAVGRPLAEVIGPLDEAGVDYSVEEVASETVAAGVVITQSPAGGRRVTATDDVRFTVSKGPEPRPVPLVVGISPEGAAWALGRSGFVIGGVREQDDSDRPAGSVVTTEPAPGTVSPRDTPVVLVVSAGPPPVTLPQLVGGSSEEAERRLDELGLVPVVTGGGASGGVVGSMDPAAGTALRRGSLVELQVSGS